GLYASRFLRIAVLLTMAVGLLLGLQPASASPAASTKSTKVTSSSGYHEPLCVSHSSMCLDAANNPGDEYVGHDEPSLEFKSGEAGSGNDLTYALRLPNEPVARPRA